LSEGSQYQARNNRKDSRYVQSMHFDGIVNDLLWDCAKLDCNFARQAWVRGNKGEFMRDRGNVAVTATGSGHSCVLYGTAPAYSSAR
jgi:hypothetical protein